MYQDAGYGENWQPSANNARRFDLYTQSCAILGCLFAIGLVLIIIIVLSLIPIYISRKSSTKNNYIQVPKVYISDYTLQFHTLLANFNSETILSESNNCQALQAALTSMIQNDSILAGSIIEIATSSQQTRQQRSTLYNINFDLYLISNTSCVSTLCLNQFQIHAINQLSHENRTTSFVRYEQPNTNNITQIFWLQYQLPDVIQSNVSFVNIDPETITSLLKQLITIDKNLNQPLFSNFTSTIRS